MEKTALVVNVERSNCKVLGSVPAQNIPAQDTLFCTLGKKLVSISRNIDKKKTPTPVPEEPP